MSVERLQAEADRWYRQAQDDLEAADVLIAGGKQAQAAFLCHQAGEKALTALTRDEALQAAGHARAILAAVAYRCVKPTA